MPRSPVLARTWRQLIVCAPSGDTFRAMSRVARLPLVCGLCGHAVASPRSDPTAGRSVFTGATMAAASSIDLNPAAIGTGQQSYLYLATTSVIDPHLSLIHISEPTRR